MPPPPAPEGLTRLASDSGLPKATAHRLLGQLAELGAIERRGGRYRIGSRIFRLGHGWQAHPRLLGAARGPVRRLAGATGATVSVNVLREGRTMVVAAVPGEVDEIVPVRPGALYPWSTAAGKVIVAGARPGLPLDPLPPSWAADAETIRDRGVAFDHEETVAGVSCVAVPLYGSGPSPTASLSVVTDASSPVARLADTVAQAGRAVSAALRPRGPGVVRVS
ncbi:IclR family transcriptional regulator [Streptomyces apricus]|uniref:Helix-turn-helix domain-containing protein n=1 Tax=Streptomyces apricus TaxID=1828112 RepID=A0A5B0BM58_9ACTN|nr:IclR family transcriptional regulator C-terminal domain-containing protein [Streptomyces apricus]KAA0942726.1 helix-turn-helix domain-containing protein [Streptomyces apricus]